MRFALQFFLCLAFTTLGFFAKAALENAAIASAIREYGVWVVVLSLALLFTLGIGFLLAFVLIRHRIRRLLKADGEMTEIEIANGLIDLLTSPAGIDNPTSQERQRAAIANFSAWLLRRETTRFYFSVTVTLIGGLIGSATLMLLYEQNQKIDEQNRRITLQTDANVTQSVLLEGARRSANAQELNTLLSDIRAARQTINTACSEEIRKGCLSGQGASDETLLLKPNELLQRRIQTYAQRSTPYFTVQPKNKTVNFDERLNSQLDLPFNSPERGRLFEELIRNGFHVAGIDFSYAALDNAELPEATMSNANLSWASLRNAELPNAHLPNANLISSDLTDANFDTSYALAGRFDYATLENTTLSGSYLVSSSFLSSKLHNVKFDSANLESALFLRSDLQNADFRKANVSGANFNDTNLTGSTFGWANISAAHFGNAIQTDIVLNTAWAWEDQLPIGLALGSKIKLCKHVRGTDRGQKTSDQSCRDYTIKQSHTKSD